MAGDLLEEATEQYQRTARKARLFGEDLYGFYARRGEGENWIKDFKLHVKADRLSCHRFIANQFRLLLHATAYWLMDALRRKLIASGSRRMQLATLRLRLVKIGGSGNSSRRCGCINPFHRWSPDCALRTIGGG